MTFRRFSWVQTDMGRAAADYFGSPEPPVTLEESVDGLTKVVRLASNPFFPLVTRLFFNLAKG